MTPRTPLPDTERTDDRFATLDSWDVPAILAALWEGQLAAIAALGPALPALGRAVDAATERLASGGRLAYAGAGTSGRIAVQDGAELTPTFDWPEDRLLLMMAGGPGALLRAVENAEDRDDLARGEVAAGDSARPMSWWAWPPVARPRSRWPAWPRLGREAR